MVRIHNYNIQFKVIGATLVIYCNLLMHIHFKGGRCIFQYFKKFFLVLYSIIYMFAGYHKRKQERHEVTDFTIGVQEWRQTKIRLSVLKIIFKGQIHGSAHKSLYSYNKNFSVYRLPWFEQILLSSWEQSFFVYIFHIQDFKGAVNVYWLCDV